MTNFIDINRIIEVASKGQNVLAELRKMRGSRVNTADDIELSYDLQSGTYVLYAESDRVSWEQYGRSLWKNLEPYLSPGSSLLDCGSGELTSLVSILMASNDSYDIGAVDLSWSRLAVGREFFRRLLPDLNVPRLFAADMTALPFDNCSIDTVLTVHALEPNGGRERPLIQELLRVTRSRLVLFEPCYETSSRAAKRRMRSHGYVRNIRRTCEDLGADVVDIHLFDRPRNQLNPTTVFVLKPSRTSRTSAESFVVHCPVTRERLFARDGFYLSEASPFVYPILEYIPLLRSRHAILASAKNRTTTSERCD